MEIKPAHLSKEFINIVVKFTNKRKYERNKCKSEKTK